MLNVSQEQPSKLGLRADFKNGCFLDSVIGRAILICPLCKGHLSFSWIIRHRDLVQRAGIGCNSCGARYEVVARIPVLLQPGQFADWTHPFVEMIFGNNRMAVDEVMPRSKMPMGSDHYLVH